MGDARYGWQSRCAWFQSVVPETVQNCRISKDVVNGSRDIRFPQNKGRKRSERLPNETEAIRTNAYQTEVQVKNYWLEYQFEKKKAHLPWDLRRVQLLESFIGPAPTLVSS